MERFFRLSFVKRDRIKDFLTSYEWLNGVLAEEVVGRLGRPARTCPDSAIRGWTQDGIQTLKQTSQGMLISPLF